MRVVHEKGFANAGIREIVRAAGVPQGSFTNHFPSKEAFGLAVIDLYFSFSREVIRDTLLNDALPPLDRLGLWIDANRTRLGQDNMKNGCLFGNFTAEAGDHSDTIRLKLLGVFGEIQSSVAYCLRAAVQAGTVPGDLPCDDVAAVIVASMQGASLLSKAERSGLPIDRFRRILFSKILR
jgi:TetR/AcrR family transcriptional regulator, transcriptional repressor for nem operon